MITTITTMRNEESAARLDRQVVTVILLAIAKSGTEMRSQNVHVCGEQCQAAAVRMKLTEMGMQSAKEIRKFAALPRLLTTRFDITRKNTRKNTNTRYAQGNEWLEDRTNYCNL